MLKIFLDDIRDPPDNTWKVYRDPRDVNFMKDIYNADIVSFDHDLGEGVPTGYDVLRTIEEEVFRQGLWARNGAPELLIHSANPVGCSSMDAAIKAIYRVVHKRKEQESD